SVTPGVPAMRRTEKSMGNEGGAAAPSLVSLFLLKTENARLYDVDFYSMEGRRDAFPTGSARSAPPCRRRPPEEAGRSRTRRGGTAPRRPLSAVPSPASAPVRGDDGGRHRLPRLGAHHVLSPGRPIGPRVVLEPQVQPDAGDRL